MIDRIENFLQAHGETVADAGVGLAVVCVCFGLLPGAALAFIFLYAFVRVYGGIYDTPED